MDLRSLLNVAYVALAQSAEDVEELDAELEATPTPVGAGPRAARSHGLGALARIAPRMGTKGETK